jgi:hypothetical protein
MRADATGTPRRRPTRTLVVVTALYAGTMAFLGGVATERIRFDQSRQAALARYDAALARWHALAMDLERVTVEAAPAVDLPCGR